MYTLSNRLQPHWSPPLMPPVSHPRHKNFFVEVLKFLGLFVFFFLILTLIVMGPTYYTKLAYLWTKPTNNYSQKYELPVAINDSSNAIADLTNLIGQPTKTYAQDTIVIPKINVEAPIVYLNTTDNKTIIDAIKDGVGHYQGTALPGHIGNVFLTGHSSYYWWSGGKYNQVFALMDRLTAGDLVYVYSQGERYIYRVSKSFVVNPNQVEVLAPSDKAILTLMTCTPVGTNLRRLIVQGNLIGRPPIIGGDFTDFTALPKPPTILPLY